MSSLRNLLGQAVLEMLWPSRCAICDEPGEVICDECLRNLPYIDVWRACPHCGSPYGLIQCDMCNEPFLNRAGRTELPFISCASATLFSQDSGQLVRVFKDAGEQRLSSYLASIMAACIPSTWKITELTYVPASKAAYRRRGFDHMTLLVHDLAKILDIEVMELLERPQAKDQRKFGAAQRFANISHRFSLRKDLSFDQRIEGLLLIDDVFTTGATLFAACDALKEIADSIYCLTFARV